MLNMGRRRGKTLKLVYRSEQFVLQKPVRSPGAIWPLLNPFKCIKTQHFSLSLVCSQKRADIQGGWPTKMSYCCTHWTLFSAWKSAENFHNAGCQHQQSSMSWSGLPQSHFWSFGSARNCFLVLLVLRMLILGRAEQSRDGVCPRGIIDGKVSFVFIFPWTLSSVQSMPAIMSWFVRRNVFREWQRKNEINSVIWWGAQPALRNLKFQGLKKAVQPCVYKSMNVPKKWNVGRRCKNPLQAVLLVEFPSSVPGAGTAQSSPEGNLWHPGNAPFRPQGHRVFMALKGFCSANLIFAEFLLQAEEDSFILIIQQQEGEQDTASDNG